MLDRSGSGFSIICFQEWLYIYHFLFKCYPYCFHHFINIYFFYCFQFFSVILGLIYLKTDNDYSQNDIMNVNGAIFVIITNLSFTNLFSVLNVSVYRKQVAFTCMYMFIIKLYYPFCTLSLLWRLMAAHIQKSSHVQEVVARQKFVLYISCFYFNYYI